MEQGARELTSVDLRVVTTDRQDVIGALGQTGDNRLFRYSSIGSSNVGAGQVVCTPANVANFLGLSVAASVTASPDSKVVTVTLGGTAATQDQFAEGTIVVISGTGAGTSYRLRGNSVSLANGTCTLYLYEPLYQSIDTTSKVNLTANPWALLVTGLGTNTGSNAPRAAGVATIPMNASTFGWVQTNGFCAVQSDGTAAVFQGFGLKLSQTTAGEVVLATGSADADKQIVGVAYAHVNNGLTNYFPAYLQIG